MDGFDKPPRNKMPERTGGISAVEGVALLQRYGLSRVIRAPSGHETGKVPLDEASDKNSRSNTAISSALSLPLT